MTIFYSPDVIYKLQMVFFSWLVSVCWAEVYRHLREYREQAGPNSEKITEKGVPNNTQVILIFLI